MNSYEKIYGLILEASRKPNVGGIHPSHYTKKGLKTAKGEERDKRGAAKKKTLLGIAVKKKEDSMSPEERLEYEEERDHQEMQDMLKGKWR